MDGYSERLTPRHGNWNERNTQLYEATVNRTNNTCTLNPYRTIALQLIKQRMETTTLDALQEKAHEIRKEIINHIYSQRGNFRLEGVGEHYVIFSLGDWTVKVWRANGKECARFYDTVGGVELDHNDCYTDEMRDELWKLVEEAIAQNGEKRRIEKTQMRNDLYFKFKGVHGDVKFTGYDDSDWWNNHKPTEISEDENITWTIDWNKMEAVYKSKH